MQELSLNNACALLPKHSPREVLTAYLILGLLQVKPAPSILLGICQKAFIDTGYFLNEYQRIFVSCLATNPYYQTIIEFLSKYRFATRAEIAKHLGIKSGGSLSTLLDDLTLCGFIEKYTPYQVDDNQYIVALYDYR